MATRIERLFNLLNVLIGADRPVLVDRVKELVPGYPPDPASFRRQFERDKAELRAMGLPLLTETVPGTYPELVGYRIPAAEAHLRDPELDPDELAALHLAATTIRLRGIEGGGGLHKLGGSPTAASGDGEGLVDLPADDRLVSLFRAVAERREATFGYAGLERRIAPYRLDCGRGRWYVTGHDHTRDATRNFRLDRIEGAVDIGPPAAFERPPERVTGVRMEPWQYGTGEPVAAQVAIDADHVPSATTLAPTASVLDERADGSVVLELEVLDADAFRSWVLGFGEHAEVLGPSELRADMVGWLTAVSERNGAARP